MADWIKYPLRGLPIEDQVRLKVAADGEDRSVSDYIRAQLCGHYGLECPPSESASKWKGGSKMMLLRLQPELYDRIRLDADMRLTGR